MFRICQIHRIDSYGNFSLAVPYINEPDLECAP